MVTSKSVGLDLDAGLSVGCVIFKQLLRPPTRRSEIGHPQFQHQETSSGTKVRSRQDSRSYSRSCLQKASSQAVNYEELGTTVLALQALQHNAAELPSRTPCLSAHAIGWPGNIAGAGLGRQPATPVTAVHAASTGRQQNVKVSDWSKGSCPDFKGFQPPGLRCWQQPVADVPRCCR